VKSGTKLLVRILLILLAVAVILVPLVIVRQDFTAFPKEPKDALAAVSDLLALFAVSFIFLDIATGAFQPLLKKVFEPDRLRRAHIVFGVTGLVLVLVHLSLLLPYIGAHYAEANHVLFFFGPLALLLLLLTIGTALFRRRLNAVWRRIHFLNYLIFAFAVAHGLVVGPDRTTIAMMAVFYVFVAVALAGLVYRLAFTDWRSKFTHWDAR
jgi:DMSO/TMAO reductase YedYZ heme-binding membrane subunit